MPILEIGVCVIAVSLLVIAYYVVPAFKQMRKTFESTDKLVEESREKLDGINTLMEEDIRTLVNNMNEAFEELNGIIKDVKADVEKVEDVVEAVSEVGDTVRSVNEIIDRSIKETVIEVASYIAGIKAVVETFYYAFSKLKRKEG